MWISLKWELEFKSGVPWKKPVTSRLSKDIMSWSCSQTRPLSLHLPAPEGSGSVESPFQCLTEGIFSCL